MSDKVEGTVRRTLRTGVIAGLIIFAGALASCSASDSYAEDNASYAGAPADEALAGAPRAEAQQDTKGADSGQPATVDRSVIITGAMYMTVDDPIAAADRTATIVQGAGGRIDARSETAAEEGYGGSASLTLRIPSTRLDAVVDDLRKLGTVDQFSTDSYDVTVEVTDLAAEISTLRASTERIEALLSQAKDIADIITLENELDGRQARLEGLVARQRGLDDQVSMSTINLSLTTEPVVIIEEEEPETFLDALASGWNALVTFLSGVLIVVGVLLPWIALIGLIALPVFLTVRAKKVRAARAADAPVASPTASERPTPKAREK